MADWVDYDSILSHSEADLYLIQGARGCGKTFNARRAAIKRYDKALEKGLEGRFCAMTRHKVDKDDIERDYFTKIHEEGYLLEWSFMWDNHVCYRRPSDNDKASWVPIGYCVALSEQGKLKQLTFLGMKHGTVIFDEVGLDRRDSSHHYLKDEYDFYYLSCMSSLLREKRGERATCKTLMLSNAVDLTCPYYDALGLDYKQLTTHGKYWCMNKAALFVNLPNSPDYQEYQEETIVGRLARGTKSAKMMFENKFEGDEREFVEPKPAAARYMCALAFAGDVFGVWVLNDVWYIEPKAPKGQGAVYSLTLADNRIDYQAVRRADNVISLLVSRHYQGHVRYHDALIKTKFLGFLRFVGVV